MIGVIGFFFACLLSILAFALYLPGVNDKKKTFQVANKIYYASVICTIIASVFFLQAILADKFQYAYVLEHSSKSLGFWYKVAAFWAGQEGSFLLWFLLHGLIGAYFLKKNKMERPAFFIYVMVQAMLALFLLAKNPFMLAQVQADGAGLNPLLQDFWMVIHPPVVFIGYAAFAVPFAYALGNLLGKHPQNDWIKKSLPWALFAWLSLGAGIFMGGYWAYKTLGWGGYWGWDPVENASLVPWLSGGALVHLLYLARREPALERLTHFSAILTFSLVLYGTFLTRSGVLSDFSVHAFSGDDSYTLLASGVFLVIGTAFAVFLYRFRSLPKFDIPQQIGSRSFLLFVGTLLFYVLAFLVFIGMSTPFFSSLFGSPQNVSASFYNRSLLLPMVFVMLALMFSPMFGWDGKRSAISSKFYVVAGLGLLAGGALCLAYGLWTPLYLVIVAFSCACMAVHALLGRKISLAASISHIGIAVMMVGIVFSSTAATTEDNLAFSADQPVLQVYGRGLSYEGANMSEDYRFARYQFSFGEDSLTLLTKLTSDGQLAAKEPAILHETLGDFYLAEQNKNLSMSFKPLVLFVWLGCSLVTAGILIALAKQIKK